MIMWFYIQSELVLVTSFCKFLYLTLLSSISKPGKNIGGCKITHWWFMIEFREKPLAFHHN